MTPTEKAAVEKVLKQLDKLTMARQQVNLDGHIVKDKTYLGQALHLSSNQVAETLFILETYIFYRVAAS